MSYRKTITYSLFGFILVLGLTGCGIGGDNATLPGEVETKIPVARSTESPIVSQTPPLAYGPAIHTIQGAGHFSPMNGQSVDSVHGIVTAVKNDGFYLQDPNPDQDVATSEGIFIFLESPPKVKNGDELLVSGVVDEYYPGGIASGTLSITEIKTPKWVRVTEGTPLPAPLVIGRGGRIPPWEIIKSDRESFKPETDGLDFYESMESMLVQVNQAVACGPSNSFKEVAVLADNGQDAGQRTKRGGILIQENDFNPERIILDDVLTILPDFDTGDMFLEPVIGILDYSFGNYKLQVTRKPAYTRGNLAQEIAPAAGQDVLSIASLNVQNLDPNDGQKRFDDYAKLIVNNLKAPDILSLDEIQDNNGPVNDAVTDAGDTYRKLIQAILAAGGPKYDFRDIAPDSNMDGGELGGNIRVGFVFRMDRNIKFVDHNGGTATTAVEIKKGIAGTELSINPGRIDPLNPAFINSRKPLVAEIDIRGKKYFIIGLHLNSKGGDTSLFGRYQPPLLVSEGQRVQQAEVVHRFIEKLMLVDPEARVLLLGDINDFQFSKSIKTLAGDLVIDLVLTLPLEEQYSYVYDGNAQVLDQMLVSPALFSKVKFYNAIHVNAEFAASRRLSDHEPILVRFDMK